MAIDALCRSGEIPDASAEEKPRKRALLALACRLGEVPDSTFVAGKPGHSSGRAGGSYNRPTRIVFDARGEPLRLRRSALDKTGLKGIYDFKLQRTPDDSQGVEREPSFFAAMQTQLGLELRELNEQAAPVKVLVVDHAEQVTGNEEAVAARGNGNRGHAIASAISPFAP